MHACNSRIVSIAWCCDDAVMQYAYTSNKLINVARDSKCGGLTNVDQYTPLLILKPDDNNALCLIIKVNASKRDCANLAHINVHVNDAFLI